VKKIIGEKIKKIRSIPNLDENKNFYPEIKKK